MKRSITQGKIEILQIYKMKSKTNNESKIRNVELETNLMQLHPHVEAPNLLQDKPTKDKKG